MTSPAPADDARRRRRRVHRGGRLVGILTTLLAAALVGAVLVPRPSRDTLPHGGAWRAHRTAGTARATHVARRPARAQGDTLVRVSALLAAAALAVVRLALLPLALAQRRRARIARALTARAPPATVHAAPASARVVGGGGGSHDGRRT